MQSPNFGILRIHRSVKGISIFHYSRDRSDGHLRSGSTPVDAVRASEDG